MRKRDCLYLHALCVLLRRELEERREYDPDAFDRYDGFAVGPTEIHHSKTHHREAVTELLDALSDPLESQGEEPTLQVNTGDGPSGDGPSGDRR